MVSLERREGAHRQNLRTQGKGQTVIREAGSQDSITSAKDDMIIKKEGRSTAPSAAELKWPEVIADVGGKNGDKASLPLKTVDAT